MQDAPSSLGCAPFVRSVDAVRKQPQCKCALRRRDVQDPLDAAEGQSGLNQQHENTAAVRLQLRGQAALVCAWVGIFQHEPFCLAATSLGWVLGSA